MKKLTLDLDALAVASFATGDALRIRGTLRAHESHLTGTETHTCPTPTCPSFAASCITCAVEER